MGAAEIVVLALQGLQMILKATVKHPETVPNLSGAAQDFLDIAGQALEETEEQRTQRRADHAALVARYAAAPPSEVKP